jgi:hypothetical protein
MQVRAVEVSRARTGFASPGGRDFFLVPSGQPPFAGRSSQALALIPTPKRTEGKMTY